MAGIYRQNLKNRRPYLYDQDVSSINKKLLGEKKMIALDTETISKLFSQQISNLPIKKEVENEYLLKKGY